MAEFLPGRRDVGHQAGLPEPQLGVGSQLLQLILLHLQVAPILERRLGHVGEQVAELDKVPPRLLILLLEIAPIILEKQKALIFGGFTWLPA